MRLFNVLKAIIRLSRSNPVLELKKIAITGIIKLCWKLLKKSKNQVILLKKREF